MKANHSQVDDDKVAKMRIRRNGKTERRYFRSAG
jgi:hypothetical protein